MRRGYVRCVKPVIHVLWPLTCRLQTDATTRLRRTTNSCSEISQSFVGISLVIIFVIFNGTVVNVKESRSTADFNSAELKKLGMGLSNTRVKNPYLHSPMFLWRQRWLLFVILIFAGTILVASQYFNRPAAAPAPPPIRDSYSDDVATEVYDEVYRRWYNFSGEEKWYNDKHLSMFDADLLTEIRENWMTKKSPLSVSYTLKEPEVRDPSMGQARVIMDIFENKTDGFFIECGAYDGETRSNTLVLERFLRWTGLLIEADPINFTKMLGKNRKAYMSPTCLSIKPYPMNVSFLMAQNVGRIHEPDNTVTEESQKYGRDVAHSGKHVTVQCFPLASYIAALDAKTVDYFSLDVEGSEMEVLQTIPFDRVDIKTLSVEYIHNKRDRRYMIDFMAKKGYYVYSFVEHRDNLANDVIFVKKGS